MNESGDTSSSDSRPSEHENKQQLVKYDDTPQFNFSEWNPQTPSALQFLSLISIDHHGFTLPPQQREHVGKIRRGSVNTKRIHQMIIGKPIDRNVIDGRRLRQAVNAEDYDLVDSLLSRNVDPCGTDSKQRSPLHLAAAKGNERLVRMLLDHNANPNQKDIIGNTALHLAACTSHIPVVTLLLKAGTDVNAVDASGRTPLHLARSRLRLLQEESDFSNDQLKTNINQIVAMMKEYLQQSGREKELSELDMLCDKLEHTSTREQLDVVGGLISNFTSLSIEKTQTG
ncbi:hypothetical protein NP493_569g01083 [Ridgeia piscesae]|uniref:Ankyrin repeat domain-containing protein 54 n=1 Tax=Ridgeia piscesae TaxID=27915 RepID=A0AAD9NPT8_RIDPI|nr:hypothetical protein NP493_569g01083 [Ridgeia piscesae]